MFPPGGATQAATPIVPPEKPVIKPLFEAVGPSTLAERPQGPSVLVMPGVTIRHRLTPSIEDLERMSGIKDQAALTRARNLVMSTDTDHATASTFQDFGLEYQERFAKQSEIVMGLADHATVREVLDDIAAIEGAIHETMRFGYGLFTGGKKPNHLIVADRSKHLRTLIEPCAELERQVDRLLPELEDIHCGVMAGTAAGRYILFAIPESAPAAGLLRSRVASLDTTSLGLAQMLLQSAQLKHWFSHQLQVIFDTVMNLVPLWSLNQGGRATELSTKILTALRQGRAR